MLAGEVDPPVRLLQRFEVAAYVARPRPGDVAGRVEVATPTGERASAVVFQEPGFTSPARQLLEETERCLWCIHVASQVHA